MTFKRIISVILCTVLLVLPFQLVGNADEQPAHEWTHECLTECGGDCEYSPVIIVPGIMQSQTYVQDADGNDIMTSDGFLGFISGIISQDHDVEVMFLDSFLKLSCLEGQDMTPVIDALEKMGDKYNIEFVLSISKDITELPENAKKDVFINL